METKIGEAKSQKDQMGNMKIKSDLQIQKIKDKTQYILQDLVDKISTKIYRMKLQ